MITGTLIFLAFLIAGAMFYLNKENIFKEDPHLHSTRFNIKAALPSFITFVAIFITALIQPYKIEKIDAGHVGIKVNLIGSNRGVTNYQYKTGWVVYNKWIEGVWEFPTYQQHVEYPEQVVITKGGFSATIKPTFNYSLIPSATGDMFVNLRLSLKQVEDGWLKTAIVGSVNDVANKWTVDSIFNNRESFEMSIAAECNKRVSKWFDVSQLRTNIVPPPALQKAIEDKTKAIQDVQVAENQKQVAIANGQKKIAIAKADSADAVIRASADARVMQLKQMQLTPLYVRYLEIQKWNGEYPKTMLGSGTGVILNNN